MNYNIGICKKDSQYYPQMFDGLKGMPNEFFYRGDISILNKYKCIAIIGSRKCSNDSLKFSQDAGEVASTKGYVVINGLAMGCDTAALIGALRNNGKCVAVMPCGLNHIVPKENSELAERILVTGGLLISEYESDAVPRKYTYAQRDRLQSALAQALLLVEANLDSGSRYAVDSAFKQERRVYTYAYDIVKSGLNKSAEDRGAVSISDIEEFKRYLEDYKYEPRYEQMKLFL